MTAPVSPSAPVAWRLVPVEPDEAMLQGACDKHTPGQPMSKHRPEECPRFATRRRIYAAMLAASPAPSMVGLREKVAEAIRQHVKARPSYREKLERITGTYEATDAILALLAREGV